MHLIAALGNPGTEYEKTRHNAGRLVMNEVMSGWGLPAPVASAKYGGDISTGVVGKDEVVVFLPATYMNNSGGAVAKALGVETDGRLVVVYDDIDLPLGEMKLTFGRGSGGHNGLKSVIESCGTPDFLRVRVGIAHRTLFGNIVRPTGDRLADYVLGQLSAREEKKLMSVVPEVAKALEVVMKEGKDKAMSMFN